MAERGELTRIIEALREKVKQRAHVVDTKFLYGNPRELYEEGMIDMFDMFQPLLASVLKTEDHRLIGHTEPDDYTKLGCLTNVATEARSAFEKDLRTQYNEDLNRVRSEERQKRTEGAKEPWGAANPASTKAEAEARIKTWGQELCTELGLWEVLGWTQAETERFADTGEVPPGYELRQE
jgi:hypothetical protein